MQKTSFPFEILINDDASTDGTADILYRYQAEHPELIRCLYQKENRYSKGLRNFPILQKMARGRYIALCEGDDYWTDPLKLQKQVDFLETHPECNICFHQVLRQYENSDKLPDVFPKFTENKILNKDYLYLGCLITSCSVLFRNIILSGEYLNRPEKLKNGDWVKFVFLAQHGDIGYLNDLMSVYRIHSNGIWSGSSEIQRAESIIQTFEFFKKENEIKKNCVFYISMFDAYFRAASLNFNSGENEIGNEYLIKCLTIIHRTSFAHFRKLLSFFVKKNYSFIIKS